MAAAIRSNTFYRRRRAPNPACPDSPSRQGTTIEILHRRAATQDEHEFGNRTSPSQQNPRRTSLAHQPRPDALDLARELAADGTNIFLDMKLLDIDNTVAKGVENVVRMGVSMLTLHAYPKAMRAAVEAAKVDLNALIATSEPAGADLVALSTMVATPFV